MCSCTFGPRPYWDRVECAQVGELEGRVFLVTGASSGIGLATAAQLACQGGVVVLACRSKERAMAVIGAVRRDSGNDAVHFVQLDLARLASVRQAAESFREMGLPLHVLINNAGVAGARGVTEEGFEVAFGTNHLGHFLLTSLLLPELRAAAPSRVVTVSSAAHFQAKGIDFAALRRPTRSLTGYREYAVSKLCNVLFAQELARREGPHGVSSFSLHPGVVASRIWRRVPWPIRPLLTRSMLTPDEGARTTLWCCSEPGLEAYSGGYFENCAPRGPSPVATPQLAARLWEESERLLAWRS